MGDKVSWPTIEWLATRTAAADAAVPREEAVAILAAHAETRRRLEERRTEAESALRSLTPGGSEFQTVEECVRYIKWLREERWESLKNAIRQRREAESALEQARRELAVLRHTIGEAYDVLAEYGDGGGGAAAGLIPAIHNTVSQIRQQAPSRPASEPAETLYPCDNCGKLRTKAEGGTTFTVCDECWNKHYHPAPPASVAEQGYRCECLNTDPNHHHCGIEGWNPIWDDKPCPGCERIRQAKASVAEQAQEPGLFRCSVCEREFDKMPSDGMHRVHMRYPTKGGDRIDVDGECGPVYEVEPAPTPQTGEGR